MASSYSTNLAIELIGTGDQAGTWGTTTNTNLGTLIEQAISGYVTQAVSTGTDTTITIPNGATGVARNMYIELTGTGGASTNLIVPSNKKLYFIFNNTASGQVTVKVSGQTGVSVPNGAKMILVSNGTDIVDATNYVGNISAASGNITTLTSSSATITNLTATSATISNFTFTSATVTRIAATSATVSDLSATVSRMGSATVTNLIATSASITTLTNNPTFGAGTANGVLYLNGSKEATSGSALTFDTSTLYANANFSLSGAGTGTRYMALLNENASYAGALTLQAGGGSSGFGGGIAMYGHSHASYPGATWIGFSSGTSTGILFGSGGNGVDSELMRLTSTGLGIGTSSPAAKLDVTGTFNGTQAVFGNTVGRGLLIGTALSSGTNEATSVLNARGAGAGAFLFQTDGTDRLTLDTSGNLGLGVTPSAWSTASSIKAFQNPAGAFWNFSTNNVYVGQNYYWDGSNRLYINSAAATEYNQGSGQHRWYTAGSGTAGNPITFTQAMTLTAAGDLVGGGKTSSAITSAGFELTGDGGLRSTRSSTSTNLATNNGGGLQLANSSATDGNFSNIGAYNSNGLVVSQIDFINVSHASRTGDIAFLTHNGSALTERARITSGGDFGIGTSSPNSYTGYTTVTINGTSGSEIDFEANNTLYGDMYASSAIMAIRSRAAIPLAFSTDSTERARITSGGNFGIANTAPDYNLSVGTPGTTANSYIQLGSTTTGTGSLFFGDTTGTGTGSYSGYVQYDHNVNALIFGTSATERARITSAGLVGIGTTTVLNGRLNVAVDPTNLIALQAFRSISATDAGYQALSMWMNNSNNVPVEYGSIVPNITSSTAGSHSGSVAIYTTNAGTLAERARVDSSGALLVGTTSNPNGRKFITSSSINTYAPNRMEMTASSGQLGGLYVVYTAHSPNDATSQFIGCDDSTTSRFVVRSNGGIANYQSNNADLSDERTKKDITPAPSYWDKIGALEIVTYKYNDQSHDDVNVGVIAQQVEAVEPVWVDSDGFGETPEGEEPLKTVYTKDITFAAIKALQEAMTRIEALEAEVAALKGAN